MEYLAIYAIVFSFAFAELFRTALPGFVEAKWYAKLGSIALIFFAALVIAIIWPIAVGVFLEDIYITWKTRRKT